MSLSAQQITVRPTACEALTAHIPRDNVAYLAGVDVSENAVVLSGLNAPGQLDFDIDHKFFPIGLPLENALAIAPTDTLNVISGSNIGAGAVTVKNSLAYFNNESLGDTQSHAIAVECQKKHDAATRLRACSRLPHIPDASILGPQHCALL